ncbi:hypothetical protein ACP70R_005094 [Stipagrostis hirtigluma subsp. patula]
MAQPGDEDGADAHLFAGVRFALVGFDTVSASQYRMEMVRCGGAMAGPRDADCTHVIVHDILFDHPVCVAARKDGKKLVTEQWVEDSLELGELADADRVLYAPVRDVKGIPGSDSLHISLTGYQKNWREDIMKMVSLMGANFSTSLSASKTTHLICYKFEGAKYDAAKMVNITCVNHRWLEDCLKAWEILPIDDYRISGWELEMLEAEVKDSEDETDGGRGSFSSRRVGRSNPTTEIRMRSHIDPDVNAPIRGPTTSTHHAVGAAGRNLGTPEQIGKAEVSTKSFDVRADIGSIGRTNDVTMSVDRGAHESSNHCTHHSRNNEPPADQASRDEAKDDHIRAPDTRASASSPSEENCCKKISQSSEMSRKIDQKDNGPIPHPKPTVRQSNVEERLNLCESDLRSEDNSVSRDNQLIGYSRRRSSKSVSPEANLRSVNQIALPQCLEGNTPRVEFNTPTRKTDQNISELADLQSLRKKEVIKQVDRSNNILAQRRKSILSSVSPKPPNEAPCSGAGIVGSPFSSKECASEAATVSDMDRRTSLKLVSPAEVEKHPVNGKNIGAEGKVKAQALQTATAEKGCEIRTSVNSEVRKESPSVNSEVRKESSCVSLQNGDIDMSDLQQINIIEVVAPNSKSDKMVSHKNLEAGTKESPVNTINSRVKNAGGKRSRNTGSKASSGLANSKSKIATSMPMHDKVVSRESAESQLGKKCSSPNAAECTSLLPEAILNSKSRNETVKIKSSHVPNSEMDDELVVSQTEFVKVTQQKNTKENHKKISSRANVDENQGSSPQKVLNSVARNSVVEGFRTADVKMTDPPSVDKTETMSLKSNFNPAENGEASPRKLSSSASADDPETCTANKVPNNRVRKVVAKRKLSAVQKHKSGSEPCKPTSVFVPEDKVVSSKEAAQSSKNDVRVTVDQDLQNTNEENANDAGVSVCEDAMEDRSKDKQSSKIRSSKRQRTADLADGSTDHDKENIPVSNTLISKTKHVNNSMNSKSITKASQNGKAVLDEHSRIEGNQCRTLNLLERTWFILSGHRLLRKEYRSILRRLKGRVCRESHHWSFQATHFVTTELRRTEKFFAAAAAGRWILKPDYLTACNEAGKFVEEEPFEWHGHGLNSGDTISLDAPRKWRQLRQRTGHGAFHGMQVVIYGECIAPTLDTLKRTIRAGDGTILATSPPYTRFLKHNVDFAVVSAGIPSVDAWVQEFMRHGIPCISADYLVEYVCKPGHPLTKHVLFNMHDLAEKSLQKLLKSQQDVISVDAGVAAEGGETDVSCSACGSNNRAGVMLICGGDANRAGCGAAVHADCCNPAVEAAPGGEWLCPKCDEQKSAKKAKKSAKSRVLKCR